MVDPVPVMVQPDTVHGLPESQVSRATRDVALGAVVMNVLHRRPHEAEAKIHERVAPRRNVKAQDKQRVERNDSQTFELDEPTIRWIKRFHERGRGAIEIPILFIGGKGEEQEDDIPQYNDNPVTAAENPVEDKATPQSMITFEVQIEGLVV